MNEGVVTVEAAALRWPLLAGKLYNVPLAIDPDRALELDRAFEDHHVGSGARIEYQSSAERKPYGVTTGGVAVIPVFGSLVHRASGLDALSGLTSYQRLQARLESAERDDDVRAVLFDIDSGGGQVAGLWALVETIAQVAKPIWAIANESAFSAAYAIAAAADRLVAPESAGMGSIGVMAMHMDTSKQDEKRGVAKTVIKAGDEKDALSSHKPLGDDGRTRLQLLVDEQYAVFVAHVASNRNVSADVVRGTEARILTAREALELGLIDGFMSFERAITELESSVAAGNHPMRDNSRATGGTEMPPTEDKGRPEDKAAAHEAELKAHGDKRYAEGFDAGKAEGVKAGQAEGTKLATARIQGILDLDEAKGREATAMHFAMRTEMTVDQAKEALAGVPQAKPKEDVQTLSSFERYMRAHGDTEIPSDPDDGDGDDEVTAAIASVARIRGGKK